MAATYTDKFYIIDPAAPPGAGTFLSAQEFDMVDLNEDGFISPTAGDTFNGLDVTRVWVGDTVTVNIPGEGETTIEGVTLYLDGAPAAFTPTDGTQLVDAEFVGASYVVQSTQIAVDDLDPVCFVRGSLIETKTGPRPVESLKSGDLVKTLDHGFVPLVSLYACDFPARGRFAPVRICQHALGNDQELWVSQQHRILITGWRAELHFAASEVLVAAKHLTNGDTIYVQEGGHVAYFHLLFDRHEVVQSAGIWSESYLPEHFMDQTGVRPINRQCSARASVHSNAASFGTARQVVPGFAAGLLASSTAGSHAAAGSRT